MRTLLLMSILSGVLILPALAQMSADDMSCADFTAMDSSGKMAAVDKMGGAMKSGDSGAMSSDAMSSDDKAPVTAESVAAACADHPDMAVHEAMMAH